MFFFFLSWPTYFLAFKFGEQRQCILYTLKVTKDDRSSLKLTLHVTMLQYRKLSSAILKQLNRYSYFTMLPLHVVWSYQVNLKNDFVITVFSI